MCADTDVPVPLQRHNATACMEGDVRNEIQATENAEQGKIFQHSRHGAVLKHRSEKWLTGICVSHSCCLHIGSLALSGLSTQRCALLQKPQISGASSQYERICIVYIYEALIRRLIERSFVPCCISLSLY